MNKRGQVTLFIILGIVLLLAIAVAIFLLKGKNNLNIEKSDNYETVFYFANSCVESSAKKAVWASFNTGFYDRTTDTYKNKFITYNESFYNPQNASNIYFLTQLRPIYLDKGTQQLPTMKNVETAIEKEFDALFKSCMNNSDFEKQYEEFSVGETTTKISLNEETVSFDLDTSIKIKNNNKNNELNTFTYTLNYPVKQKYKYAADFIDKQSQNDDFIIGHLSYLAKTNNFKYTITYYDESTLIFEFLFDDYTEIYGEKLVYGFVIKYDWT